MCTTQGELLYCFYSGISFLKQSSIGFALKISQVSKDLAQVFYLRGTSPWR